jgi:beta-1,4-mannosyl-glycoprotein beta-1,4-N-acetylglucosaminyltransferase
MIIDVFPFFDELDLLEIRLNTLDPFVDLFLLSEYSTTFAGNPKPYNFEENSILFSKFAHKIIYLRQEQKRILSPFENDDIQKNSIKHHLMKVSSPGDLILFGDIDEIPEPSSLGANLAVKADFFIKHFAQQVSYGYLNLVNHRNSLESIIGDYSNVRKPKWLGTVLAPIETVEKFELSELRLPKHKSLGQRISNGGWHFSYCGGYGSNVTERLKYKLQNNAHQEFNSDNFLDGIELRLLSGRDILGRRTKRKYLPGYTQAEFRIESNLDFLPSYVIGNQNRFEHLLIKRRDNSD